MDEDADEGGGDGHVFLVGEVEAVEEGGEAGGAVDDGFVGLGGDGGREGAEAWVGPDAEELGGEGPDVGVGFGVARVDGGGGVGLEVGGGEDEGVGEAFADLREGVVVLEEGVSGVGDLDGSVVKV